MVLLHLPQRWVLAAAAGHVVWLHQNYIVQQPPCSRASAWGKGISGWKVGGGLGGDFQRLPEVWLQRTPWESGFPAPPTLPSHGGFSSLP